MKTTYNDVLSGFESADIVAVVAVVHLLQNRNHTGHKTPLEGEKKHKSRSLRTPSYQNFGFRHPVTGKQGPYQTGNILRPDGLQGTRFAVAAENDLLPGFS